MHAAASSARAWVLGPLGTAPPAVAVAAIRAGALGFVAVDGTTTPVELAARRAAVVDRIDGADLGAVVAPDTVLDDELATEAARFEVVLLAAGWPSGPALDTAIARLRGLGAPRVAVEVLSRDEARAAVAAGADELVAKGHEAGGRVGATSTFVLLQQLAADPSLAVPIRARGGIGLHTAGAALVAGAAGVVLDDQLASCREVRLPWALAAAVRAADGSETVVVGGHRLYTRPDLPVADLVETSTDDDPTLAEALAHRLGTDLRTDLVPCGQDIGQAATLADRYVTIGGVVQAVETAADAAVADAARLRPLQPGGPLAEALGTAVPVVQGPMTRVSDRAGFAAAVAEGGGLPFLALALLRGPDVRALLEETRDRLGDRPWGVGVLGFVPPELREEQLAVVREIAPPVALIAGGRPSQAAPLQEQGIDTFLHVPSPGLLDRFLADGARRFVFEGRECGGHVGPRSSFALWDAQVTRLLAHADRTSGDPARSLADVQVLLAGGIHDERSAAMAAVIAAPLAARGASVGVLMGTAYLFTDAAVAEGAIRPTFQRAAVECGDTALLQTSPGHAIRCARSPFVDVFAETERQLVAEGLARDERWLRLEDLNLGRLRVASKGLERTGDELVDVDDDRQWDEGLFMLGDVATLRHEVTTVAALHEQVTAGATAFVADVATRAAVEPPVAAEADPLDIAIVGMATVLPGADDLETFWANVVGGVDSVTEVPDERWVADRWYASGDDAEPGVTTPSRWGGFVPRIPFDALAYGIPPKSLASIETVQLLALEVANRALADAGYAHRPFDRERTSVIFGAEAGTDLSAAYGLRASFRTYFGDLPAELDEHLPRLTEDSFPGLLTNVIAGRVANRLDLGGSNFTVDAACASSLAALDIACKELTAGTSDLVLCGGADLHNGIHDYLLFSSVHALSPGGRCRTFDAEADAIVLGEGVVCLALKRRVDAERDGDRIYGVVRSVASSSDGRHLGLTAPRPEGQERALTRAYDRAGIGPSEIGLVEAHGTGTTVGDRTELSTLRDVFERELIEPGSVAVGSVKSNIGHTKCTAGLAGLVKATLAVQRGVLPPTLHVRTPNPAHDPDAGPFAIYDRARPWTAERRVAGVSAFGFGGTNFHAVVEGHTDPAPDHGTRRWDAELVLLRGDDAAIARTAAAVRERVAAGPVVLADLAATVSRQGAGPVRAAIVAATVDELVEGLDAAVRGEQVDDAVLLADPDVDRTDADRGRVAFLFSGQGSQRPHMLADLFVAFPGLRRHLAPGDHLLDTLFPPQAFDAERRQAQRDAVTDTRVAQPALGMVELALADLLERCGVTPDLAAGHSYGEVAALAAAGALPADRLVAISEARAAAILGAAGDDPGAMAAVSAAADDVRAHLDDRVVLANDNAPRQAVIAGPTDAVAETVERLAAAGLSAKPLPVACAFHSPVVAGADATFAAHLADVPLAAPRYEVWSNTTAAPHGGPDGLADALAAQITHPVRWTEQVEAMWEAGARTFVEVGPGRVLGGLVDKILGDRPHTTLATDVPGEGGLRRLLLTLARLATLGVAVDVDPLFDGRTEPVDLRATPSRPGWTIDGHLVRTAEGAAISGGLRPVTERPTMLSPLAGAPADSREDLVRQYLDGMADLVTAQRDVMLAVLGADPAPPIARTRPVAATAGDRAEVVAIEAVATDGRAAEADAAPARELTAEELLRTVLDLVSERTGYPLDMLEPDLDLEADLSIDSIKRIEIIGELFDRLPGFSADTDEIADEVVEELAAIKTVAGIVEWIHLKAPGADGPAAETVPAARLDDATPAAEHPATAVPARARRFEVRWDPAVDEATTPPARVTVVDDGRVGPHLRDRLAAAGCEVTFVAPTTGRRVRRRGVVVDLPTAAVRHRTRRPPRRRARRRRRRRRALPRRPPAAWPRRAGPWSTPGFGGMVRASAGTPDDRRGGRSAGTAPTTRVGRRRPGRRARPDRADDPADRRRDPHRARAPPIARARQRTDTRHRARRRRRPSGRAAHRRRPGHHRPHRARPRPSRPPSRAARSLTAAGRRGPGHRRGRGRGRPAPGPDRGGRDRSPGDRGAGGPHGTGAGDPGDVGRARRGRRRGHLPPGRRARPGPPGRRGRRHRRPPRPPRRRRPRRRRARGPPARRQGRGLVPEGPRHQGRRRRRVGGAHRAARHAGGAVRERGRRVRQQGPGRLRRRQRRARRPRPAAPAQLAAGRRHRLGAVGRWRHGRPGARARVRPPRHRPRRPRRRHRRPARRAGRRTAARPDRRHDRRAERLRGGR